MGQHLPFLVTVLNSILIFVLAFRVGLARGKFGIKAPATHGNVDFERVFRSHMNTIESTIYFLPLMWTFAYYISPLYSGILGLIWIVGRVFYANWYSSGKSRTPAFFLCVGICAIYTIGSLFGIIRAMLS